MLERNSIKAYQWTRSKRPLVLGFCGKAGVGKSYAADIIREHYGHIQHVPFAGPLKAIMTQLGLPREKLNELEYKETPNPMLCGKTPREVMQYLGTEFGREFIGGDLWVDLWKRHVEGCVERWPNCFIVVDDVRFQNEVDAIHSFGGIVVEIRSPKATTSFKNSDHKSEQQKLIVDAHVYNERGTYSLVRGLDRVFYHL